MKFLHLVWAGIWRKRVRAVLTFLSVVNAFILFGILQGFASGLETTIAETHADSLLTASKISQLEPLPMAAMAQIASAPGVRAVAPVTIFHSNYRTQTQFVRAFAVEPERLAAADPALTVTKAQVAALREKRTGALAPSTVAAQYGWKVGQRITLKSLFWTNRDGTGNWPVDIVGVFPTNKDDLFFGSAILVNQAYLDEGRTTAKGTTSVYLVRVNDPKSAGSVAIAIDRLFANSAHETKTASERQIAQDSVKAIGDVGLVVRLIVGAVFFALLFSVGAVMMQSVRERTPELAVLKTIGFTDQGLLSLVLAESLIFCLIAAVIGLGLASAAAPLSRRLVGFELARGSIMSIGLAFAVLLALATGLPPAVRAMRLRIVDALAGR
ncbi:MAG TPA: FtsX-like permease family protein [Chloroflexota bacterium]|nr:FtsX-like permease family protein [Chloroflexota bacterium]